MIKLLIADDEPLVCVGLQSMLRWEEYDIEIVGTARNGQQAADMIEELRPDIVITDIKMPLKNGLELCAECEAKYGRIPVFIMLTSFEEFALVRKAISHQAVDYLIKLELDEKSLATAITKAIGVLQTHKKAQLPEGEASASGLPVLRERFFVRLFNDLFETREQYLLQKEELGIEFTAAAYAVGVFALELPDSMPQGGDKIISLCESCVQMARETLAKYMVSYVTPLDLRHFAVVFCFEERELDRWGEMAGSAMEQMGRILHNYFSVQLRGAVGRPVEDPGKMAASYHEARRAAQKEREEWFTVCEAGEQREDAPPLSAYFEDKRISIRRAFEELDAGALHTLLGEVAGEMSTRPQQHLEAMDTACNILYMAFSLLPEGERILQDAFAGEEDGYRSLYRLRSVDEIVEWLECLRDGCCATLGAQRQSYKTQVVHSVQAYIRRNLDKKLTLNEVAAVFNFSPNYLSQLFTKYAEAGFVEYITGERIRAAKEMLARGEGRVYEIAERLGFESSFYFSKVFKKVEGISPREYIAKLNGEAVEEEVEG